MLIIMLPYALAGNIQIMKNVCTHTPWDFGNCPQYQSP